MSSTYSVVQHKTNFNLFIHQPEFINTLKAASGCAVARMDERGSVQRELRELGPTRSVRPLASYDSVTTHSQHIHTIVILATITIKSGRKMCFL